MANLTKLKFFALDIYGKSYLASTLDSQIHLDSTGLRHIVEYLLVLWNDLKDKFEQQKMVVLPKV